MAQYVTDYTSLPARTLTPLLRHMTFDDELIQEAKDLIIAWEDFQLSADSKEAAIYVTWERTLRQRMEKLVISEELGEASISLTKVVDWLVFPDGKFGESPITGRDDFLKEAFVEAIYLLQERLGDNLADWKYGQEKFKHIRLKHPMSAAVNDVIRDKLEVGPYPRGGNGTTVGSTGSNDNQSSGASFRVIIDTGDFDKSLFTNSPGQSGDPDSAFYDNLFETWAQDKFFPLFYSREKVESVASQIIKLSPLK